MKINRWGLIATLFYLASDIYILFWRTQDILGNMEATWICSAPFVFSHILIHRQITKHNKDRHDN